jgi:LemA protein
MGALIAIIVVVVVVLLIVWFFWGTYNSLVKGRVRVKEAWSGIDVQLKRRSSLIPNLVETVKGYAAHERGTLEDVMKARSAAMSGGQSPAQQAQSEGLLSQALGRLIAVAEAYPDLKANQNFMALQNELTATEDRIASARRYYNANVRELNTKVETVPSNIVAGMFNIGRAEYFEVEGEERDPVKVDFGQRDATIPPPSGYAGGTPAGAPASPPPAAPSAGEASAAGPAPEAAAPQPPTEP